MSGKCHVVHSPNRAPQHHHPLCTDPTSVGDCRYKKTKLVSVAQEKKRKVAIIMHHFKKGEGFVFLIKFKPRNGCRTAWLGCIYQRYTGAKQTLAFQVSNNFLICCDDEVGSDSSTKILFLCLFSLFNLSKKKTRKKNHFIFPYFSSRTHTRTLPPQFFEGKKNMYCHHIKARRRKTKGRHKKQLYLYLSPRTRLRVIVDTTATKKKKKKQWRLHNCGNTNRGNYTTPTIYQKNKVESTDPISPKWVLR